MNEVKFDIKPNDYITTEKCPKCGNDTQFICKSQRVCEDSCEIWVECICGYDPTENDSLSRMEDIWGNISKYHMLECLSTWNEVITNLKNDEKTQLL